MASVFTKIINKELPSYTVYEDEKVIAFLALGQINLGHCLVVPKEEVDHFFDIEDESYKQVFMVAKKISKAIKKATECRRVGVAIQGFEVAHAHVHLIPLNSADEFSFSNQKERSSEDMKMILEKIREEMA